jgi:hypothetical protein
VSSFPKETPAIAGMEKAYAEHDERLPWLAFDPLGDSLLSDPRYRELLNRLNLPGLPRETRTTGPAREPR